MPAASSSRRKVISRRQNSEDIEEDGASQRQMDEVQASDEDAPQRSGKRVKKEKAKGKAKAPEPADSDDNNEGDDDEGDSDDERIDVSNFKNQPLKRSDERNLSGLVEDWKMLDNATRTHWSMIKDIAVAIADALEEDTGEGEVEELDEIMRGLVDLSAEMQGHASVIHEVRQKVAQGQDVDDVMDGYLRDVKAAKKEYAKKTTRQKYAKNEEYVKFKTGVWEAQHPDTPMPPVTDFIPKEDGDDSDDDDLEIGGQTQDYKCPISLTLLVNPVTSTVCGHSYSAESIREMFRSARGGITCPASGCRKPITLAQCKPNPELAKRVKAFERRKARHDEHSDAEEVID